MVFHRDASQNKRSNHCLNWNLTHTCGRRIGLGCWWYLKGWESFLPPPKHSSTRPSKAWVLACQKMSNFVKIDGTIEGYRYARTGFHHHSPEIRCVWAQSWIDGMSFPNANLAPVLASCHILQQFEENLAKSQLLVVQREAPAEYPGLYMDKVGQKKFLPR